jgi:HK97 family phage prohead protease
MNKLFSTNIKIKASDEDRTVEFIASKEVVDRDREIIKVKGIDLKSYKKNPVVLFAHNKFGLPIGKTINITKTKDTLKMKVQFATAEEYAFADTIYRLVKGGYLNAVSIGFMPDYEKIEYDDKKRTRIFNSVEMFELSVVPVPANQEALTTGKSVEKALEDKVIDEDEFEEWEKLLDENKDYDEGDYIDDDTDDEVIKGLQERIDVLEQKIEELSKSKEDDVETYFDDILKEFKPAGGTSDDDPNTEAKSLDNLLNEYLSD